jgi:hypothetical protein
VISINDFCVKHRACQDGRAWALDHCETMVDVWATAKPDWLIWVATRPGVLPDRELRLFAVFCARQVEHLLTDQRSRDAIAVAEKFANGEATSDELAAARHAAAGAAAGAAAAWAAGAAAAGAAAWDAGEAADAARTAAWAAGAAAARAAAWDAGAAAARGADYQANWLRANAKPNFEVEVQS